MLAFLQPGHGPQAAAARSQALVAAEASLTHFAVEFCNMATEPRNEPVISTILGKATLPPVKRGLHQRDSTSSRGVPFAFQGLTRLQAWLVQLSVLLDGF